MSGILYYCSYNTMFLFLILQKMFWANCLFNIDQYFWPPIKRRYYGLFALYMCFLHFTSFYHSETYYYIKYMWLYSLHMSLFISLGSQAGHTCILGFELYPITPNSISWNPLSHTPLPWTGAGITCLTFLSLHFRFWVTRHFLCWPLGTVHTHQILLQW